MTDQYRVYPITEEGQQLAAAKRVSAEHQREALHKGLVHVRPADEAILPQWEYLWRWRVDLMDRNKVIDYWLFDKRLWMDYGH